MQHPNPSKQQAPNCLLRSNSGMLFLQSSQNAALVNAVRAALLRIEGGTFGLCMNCEQEINMNRLKAIPWVRYCIICQGLIDEQR